MCCNIVIVAFIVINVIASASKFGKALTLVIVVAWSHNAYVNVQYSLSPSVTISTSIKAPTVGMEELNTAPRTYGNMNNGQPVLI